MMKTKQYVLVDFNYDALILKLFNKAEVSGLSIRQEW